MKSCLLCLFLIPILLLTACEGNKQDKEAIATVNNTPILLEDFQKEVSLYSKRQPSTRITSQTVEDHLKTMIEKQLLIQEATKRGLAEDKRFVETIKTFWEQTLIRELINAKNKEWEDRLFVSEDEIQKQYRRMQYMPSVRIAKARTREIAEDQRLKMLKGEHIEGEKIIGPLFYEDVRSPVLQNAFDMDIGEAKLFDGDGEYIVINLMKKEKITAAPLKDVYERIKESILEQKKQKALEEWLEAVKRSSNISINTKLLTEITHEK
jgi:hypothetical protein